MWILDFCISFVVFENYERCTAPIKSENGRGCDMRYDSEDGDDSTRKSVRPVSRSIEVSEGQVNFEKMTCLEMIRRSLIHSLVWGGVPWINQQVAFLLLNGFTTAFADSGWGWGVGFPSHKADTRHEKKCHWTGCCWLQYRTSRCSFSKFCYEWSAFMYADHIFCQWDQGLPSLWHLVDSSSFSSQDYYNETSCDCTGYQLSR